MDLDEPDQVVLDHLDCVRLLGTGGLGRVGVSVRALPVIVPVRYAMVGEEIYFVATLGSPLERTTRGAVVAFEADGLDPGTGFWTVTATGLARHEPAASAELLGRLGVHPAAESVSQLVAVTPQVLAGWRAGLQSPVARVSAQLAS